MLLDLLGSLASLLSTYYFIRLTPKAWSISLMATSINASLYWQKGIYADTILELFYFLSSCYGWYLWRKPHKKQPVRLSNLGLGQYCLIFALSIGSYLLIVNLLTQFTDSNIASLDALTTTLSLVAQGLMCHKLIVTWIVWFFADAIYAYLYFQKHLTFHCLLMLVYTGMAVSGYLSWSRHCIPKSPSADVLLPQSGKQED